MSADQAERVARLRAVLAEVAAELDTFEAEVQARIDRADDADVDTETSML